MSVTLEVRKLLEKADHALELAEELKRKDYHSDAASKVYYAMFYAAQALLKSEEVDVKSYFYTLDFSAPNLIEGTEILGAFAIRSELSINFAIHWPTSALTIFSPHCGHTPAGTSSTTISSPLIQKSCLIYFSCIGVSQISHSP